jgi:hypothetical protein
MPDFRRGFFDLYNSKQEMGSQSKVGCFAKIFGNFAFSVFVDPYQI